MNKRIEFVNGTTRTVENLLGWIPINEYCRKEEPSTSHPTLEPSAKEFRKRSSPKDRG